MKNYLEIVLDFIKKYSLKVFDFLAEIFKKMFARVGESFEKCVNGEEKLNKMLWCWCIIPNAFFISTYFNFLFQFIIVKVFVLFYAFLCIYFISKAVKVHPEYNVTEVKRKEELEYINSLNEEQLKEYYKDKKRQNLKDFGNKLLLQKSWKTTEFYKITRLFLMFVILFVFMKIFN